jgi:hypothetical protein
MQAVLLLSQIAAELQKCAAKAVVYKEPKQIASAPLMCGLVLLQALKHLLLGVQAPRQQDRT